MNCDLSFPIDLPTVASEERDKLGGGGIAAIIIIVLLIVAAAVVAVFLIGIWYYCHSRTGIKRSGKYVVDNSDIEGKQTRVIIEM